jgi:hypothetical protein
MLLEHWLYTFDLSCQFIKELLLMEFLYSNVSEFHNIFPTILLLITVAFMCFPSLPHQLLCCAVFFKESNNYNYPVFNPIISAVTATDIMILSRIRVWRD